MYNLLVICGPTASGKTHLGVALALHLNGEILSADSRQVYRQLDIGTGKDLHEYATPEGTVPYHLIDMVNPCYVYTLFEYKKEFFRIYNEVRKRNRFPVMVGGTGLYIEAVLKNYQVPSVPEDPELRNVLMQADKEWLEKELLRIDKERYVKTDLSSKKRIVRAIEIATN